MQAGTCRGSAMRIVHNKWFEPVILVVILANCVAMALDQPSLDERIMIDPRNDATMVEILFYVDVFFTLFFTVEMLLKIVAWGIICHSDSYLRRDSWNRFDFLLVLISWVDYAMAFAEIDLDIHMLRSFRLLRVFRTLRCIPPVGADKLPHTAPPQLADTPRSNCRMVAKIDGLRKLVGSLEQSFVAIFNIWLVSSNLKMWSQV
eukprot:SAG11_NODE_541_length_8643_cov_21.904963_2_plen_204_part_00